MAILVSISEALMRSLEFNASFLRRVDVKEGNAAETARQITARVRNNSTKINTFMTLNYGVQRSMGISLISKYNL
mgnify:CR=1 FL=1